MRPTKAHAIALGHHADDQAETWFLHALRSADPWSIMGMSAQEGQVVRPMLHLNRSDIRGLAEARGWRWQEDASNASSKYLRNRIRHELLPLLEDIKPGSIAHIQRLASCARDLHVCSRQFWKRLAQVPNTPRKLVHRDFDPESFGPRSVETGVERRGWSDASAQRVHTLLDAEVGQEVQHGSKRVIRDRHALTVTSLKETSQPEVRIDLEQAGQGH